MTSLQFRKQYDSFDYVGIRIGRRWYVVARRAKSPVAVARRLPYARFPTKVLLQRVICFYCATK